MIVRALILSFLTFISHAALANNKNPMMRTCRISGGLSWVVNLNQDEVLLCRFDNAAIGSLDLLLYKSGENVSQSISALVNGTTDTSVCEQIVETTDLEGKPFELCVFSDRSIVLTQTLRNGLNHADNEKLRKALGL